MNILITGAKGFVGRNLVAALESIRDGKDRTHAGLVVNEIYAYDIDSTAEELDEYCSKADFVFNLAGVNRPKDNSEFMAGNFGFASTLLDTLKKHNNKCPVMLSSSIQATLAGRFGNSEYGRSKKAGEELFFEYGKENGVRVLVYRFPNLFGKWCRPNYNSAVATFCNNIANDLPIQVNDPNVDMELLYIDDLVAEMVAALQGGEHYCTFNGMDVVPVETSFRNVIPAPEPESSRNLADGEMADPVRHDGNLYCHVPTVHKIKLGEIVTLLNTFHDQPKTLVMPEIPNNSFAKKLYSTYLSYLPKEKVSFPLKMNVDARGSFTELLKTVNCGQFSVNVSKPGITKGEHWHHTKWEFFIVVSGRALIQERKIGTDEIIEFEVSGEKIEAVHMLPGYTHNIINLSNTENLVTVMWANESFDPNHPDTFGEKVVKA